MKLLYGQYAVGYDDYLHSNDAIDYEYRVAIPSYKRAETLKNKTLNLLAQHKVSPNKIDIFVANEEEELVYEKTLPKGMYARIIVGIVGMGNIRNFIQSYYPEGQCICCMDDDLEEIYIAEGKQKKAIANFDKLISYAFALCDEVKTNYWGVYAVDNPFFMKKNISVGLRYLIGSFWGMRVMHYPDTYVTMDDKEDFERSVRAYLKYGNVVRIDYVGMTTRYYTEPGGMQIERTEKRIIESGRRLIQMFPMQVCQNTARKKHFEVALRESREALKKSSRKKFAVM